jgi:nitrogen fixation protein NifZ
MMTVEDLEEGDVVYAKADIFNDGSFPEAEEDAKLVDAGTRGMIVRKGHSEEQPELSIFLVRFEDANQELGPPLGCWAEELSMEGPS